MGDLLVAVGLYSPIVTKIVDALRNIFDKGGQAAKWVWNITALAVGVLVAFALELNPAVGIPALKTAPLWVLRAVTGLAIGAASSGWHEVFDALSGFAKRQHAVARDVAAAPPVMEEPSSGDPPHVSFPDATLTSGLNEIIDRDDITLDQARVFAITLRDKISASRGASVKPDDSIRGPKPRPRKPRRTP